MRSHLEEWAVSGMAEIDFKNRACPHKKVKMSKLHFTTKHANAASVQRKWHIVDGTNQTVGRISSKIAAVLRGKNKAYYSPHVDCGDFVIVTEEQSYEFHGHDEADARLIAAAPDLLDALVCAESAMNNINWDASHDANLIDRIRAAIRKATERREGEG